MNTSQTLFNKDNQDIQDEKQKNMSNKGSFHTQCNP